MKPSDKQTIMRILQSLPGDVVLVTAAGTVLGSKITGPETEYRQWPFVALFPGTSRGCRLYWNVPGGYDPVLTAGPLELLLAEHVSTGDDFWLRRLLTEPLADWELSGLPEALKRCFPFRLGVMIHGGDDRDDVAGALRQLLPGLLCCRTEPGMVLLQLPVDPEQAEEWSTAAVSLVSEELLADALLLSGPAVPAAEVLPELSAFLARSARRLYASGLRGVEDGRLRYAEALALHSGLPGPVVELLSESIAVVVADPELDQTACIFLKTHMNIAETAQALFLHRNTLVYRLAKIERLTGLDLKRFDHAMAFWLMRKLMDTVEPS